MDKSLRRIGPGGWAKAGDVSACDANATLEHILRESGQTMLANFS
jgi:hypothetical protein